MSDDYDVLVIGAGILGLSIAYHLKKNNSEKNVLLVDRLGDVAQGNTSRSNAMFRNTFTSWDNLILADSSIDYYLDTQNSGVDLGLRQIGYLWVMDEKQLSANQRHIELMQDNMIDLKLYDRRDLGRAVPSLVTKFDAKDEEASLMKLTNVAGAVFGIKCGRLDPAKLSKHYHNSFLDLGGKMELGTEVTSLITEASEPLGLDGEPFVWQDGIVAGARVKGKIEGEIRAKKVIIAAGVWNNEILDPIGIDGHVKAKKRQLFTVSAKNNTSLQSLMYNRNFNELGVLPYVILPKSGCYLKAVEESNEFWLGCEDDFNRPYFNVPEETLDDLKAEPNYYEKSLYPILRKYFPQFENLTPNHMWAGYYSMNTLDSMPFVFAQNGIIIAGGGSGSGIMKGDAMGRLVEAMYSRGEDAEAELYGNRKYPIDRLGFKRRRAEREEWVI
jgi:FAD-dependent oxidoreductase domain-containing protein 1